MEEELNESNYKLYNLVVKETLKSLFRLKPNKYGFLRSTDIQCFGWQRLYVRGHTKDKIVFANISLNSDIRGNKIFSRVVKELKRRGVSIFVENPQELLTEFCETNNIPIKR